MFRNSTSGKSWAERTAKVAAVACFLLFGATRAHAQCEVLRSGATVWVRLLTPLASYSAQPGNKVRAVVIDSPMCEGAPVIPAGSLVAGEVTAVKRVGMGLVHESAALRVEFTSLQVGDSATSEIAARLKEIDNARETVKEGTIHGVNPTDTPQGRITSRLKHLPTFNPYSDLTLLAYRMAFPVFPEPEIYLPRGADLKLEFTADAMLPAAAAPPYKGGEPDATRQAVMTIVAGELPGRTTTRYGQDADIVNVALVGTAEQMDAAFRAAGWANGDPTTPRSVLKQAHAFLSFSNYPNAPISTQLVQGERVTTTWEKGLDSYAKREHLRVWDRENVIEGKTVWLGAMTRETGATLSVRQHKFIHHIDADMDQGRALLVRDLRLAGCVSASYEVARPELAGSAMNATGDPMRTDGSLEVVELRDCENPVFQRAPAGAAIVPTRPHSRLARYLRMQIMSFRSDLIRGNVIYGAFDLTRMAIRARRQHVAKSLLAKQTAPPAEPQMPVAAPETTAAIVDTAGDADFGAPVENGEDFPPAISVYGAAYATLQADQSEWERPNGYTKNN